MDGVVITGRGAVSPIGVGADRLVDGLVAGEVSIAPAPWVDTHGRFAWWSVARDFRPEDWLDDKLIAGTDLYAQFALAAAQQAVDEAGLVEPDPRRTAVVHGTSMGGMRALLKAQHALDTEGPEAIDRKAIIQFWPNMAAAQIAMRWDLHGPLSTVCTACASSIDAIGTAARLIAEGRVDVAITGGTDGGFPAADGTAEGDFAPANYYCQALYGMEGQPADRLRACLPFDQQRSGIVTGEGSAFVVLERAETARARGATILAEVTGYGSLADAFHPSSPEPTGRWEAEAMRDALADADTAPGEIDAVVAHATATPKGDTAEIRAINDIFRGTPPPTVTGLKGNLGHTGASAGAMGVLAALNTFDRGVLPHVAGTRDVDPEAEFPVVTEKPAELDAARIQVNAFGFGGQNASLVLRAAAR